MSTKDEIICDFTDMIDQIGQKPSDEIESGLQEIIYRVRPYIHMLLQLKRWGLKKITPT